MLKSFPMTYSTDLRLRVVEYVEKGGSPKDASSIFRVSLRVIWMWIRRKNEGNLAPKKRKCTPRKIDYDHLKEFIKNNPDAYLREIAHHCGVTIQAIFYACKRLKITLKKRPHSTRKEMKKNV